MEEEKAVEGGGVKRTRGRWIGGGKEKEKEENGKEKEGVKRTRARRKTRYKKWREIRKRERDGMRERISNHY